MKQLRRFFLILVLAVLTVGVSSPVSAAPKLSTKKLTLFKGEKKKLKVKGTKAAIKWSSSKKKVASVAKDGTVTAKKKGTAVITAKAGTAKLTCKVTVEVPKLNKTSITLKAGEKASLKVQGTSRKFKWSSSDKSVAAVSSKGQVSAKKPGTAKIYAVSGKKKLSCTVKVKEAKKAQLTLNHTSRSIQEGESFTLTASFSPADAEEAGEKVVWSSSDTAVASVEAGVVTGLKKGTAVIRAAAGSMAAECEVTVTKREIPIESIELDKTEAEVTEGESITLKTFLFPSDTTDADSLTWISSNPEVATVENGVITGIAPGTTKIWATAAGKKAECALTVLKKEIPLTGIRLDQTSIKIGQDESVTLHVIYEPENTTDDKTVTWTSSRVYSVGVTEEGKVLGKYKGSAVITAKVGDKEATCQVEVTRTREKCFEMLKQQIEKEGSELSSGKKAIILDSYDNSSSSFSRYTITISLIYDEAEDTLTFFYSNKSWAGATSSLSMVIGRSENSYAQISYLIRYNEEKGFATVKIKPEQYDGGKITNFELAGTGYYTDEKIVTNANGMFKTAMNAWADYLRGGRYGEVHMDEFGFTVLP